MGFASGFRTGLATGDRRSMMPIVQGLGSMIDRIQARNKRGSVRFAGSSGPSSYEKYTARKDQEEAAAEEKRRYEAGQMAEREQMATEQQAAEAQAEQAAVGEERAAETHASRMATEQQQREKAAEMFKRSKKKEDRIEAFRGLLQGAASHNKALVEEAWAALSPDMPEGEKESQEFAAYKEEMVEETDPVTGEVIGQHRKFTVGRDPKTGAESEKALPGPAVTFNDDGSVTVESPGEDEPKTFANDDEFLKYLAIFHPEAENKQSLEAAEKKAETKKERTRKGEKHQLALIKAEQGRIDKARTNESVDPDELDKRQAKLDKRREKITGGVEGKAEKRDVYVDKGGNEIYAGENTPPGYSKKDVKQHPKTKAWYELDPETGKYSKPILATK